MPVVTSTVVSTQPSSGTWTTSLFDCCSDMSTCCCGMWFFPCMQCQTVSQFGWCFLLPVLDPCTCQAISCFFRQSMRDRYNIQGSCCDDCCVLCFCYSCAWCQMAREVKNRGYGRAVGTNVVTQTTVVL
ncbi:plac8 onzin related protein 1 isoform X2 [Scleropages formosus]|uniref:Plac8 onzin related protein 1 n=2 Tax=Scleropages formosus TaxID=113540 RepID=A0A8C9V9S0_SCLFO|nr:cornifelin homolog A-like isoform X2 [Scleropages formosus]XP_018588805.1 cornifelin homolog A-like isoform X2 [Scleropages formosus]